MKKKIIHLPTYPIFFQTVTGNKQYFFLSLDMLKVVISCLCPGCKWVNSTHRETLFSFKVLLKTSTGELGYDEPLYDGFSHMTDDMLGPSPMHLSIRHLYTTDFSYDAPIFLVPLSLSYPSSPVILNPCR